MPDAIMIEDAVNEDWLHSMRTEKQTKKLMKKLDDFDEEVRRKIIERAATQSPGGLK